jgi:outer membrane protein
MKNAWRVAAVAAGLAGVLTTVAARADEDGPWEIRVRAVYLDPANKSDAINALAVPKDAIHINSKVLPDIDFEYYFTPNWSTELLLTIPQKQTVTVEKSALGGPTAIGTFKHLPPTLLAKYNFLPEADFRPYVGAGVNLTYISNVDLAVPTVGRLDLKHWSVGPAAQAGFDYKIADHWYLNADVKWMLLHSDISLGGDKISQARINPFLFGIGVGYRFGGGHGAAAAATTAAVAAPVAAAPPPPPPPAPVAAVVPPPPPPPAPPTQELVLKDVTFATGSAKLLPGSEATLSGVAKTIQQCGCKKVDIRGYTDSVGKPASNQKLSENRAQAVKAYLEAHGVAAGVLTAQGFGEENPVASNKTADGRAKNRRVTVQFGGR